MARFGVLLRLETRFAARDAGYGFFEINRMMAKADDAKVSQAVSIARGMGHSVPDELLNADSGEGNEKIGDGTIIKGFFSFLQSEQGQALIKILLGPLIAAV